MPFPLMVRTVPLSFQVQSPVVPLVAEAAAASNENAAGNDTNSIVSVSSTLKMRFAIRFSCFIELDPPYHKFFNCCSNSRQTIESAGLILRVPHKAVDDLGIVTTSARCTPEKSVSIFMHG